MGLLHTIRSLFRRRRLPTLRPKVHLGVEALERRELMASSLGVVYNTHDRVLRIDGTGLADNIRIVNNAGQISVAGQQITVINGAKRSSVASLPLAQITQAVVKGGDGDDRIEMVEQNVAAATALTLVAYGERGNDTLIGGSARDVLMGGAGIDKFFASLAKDTYDWNASAGETFVDQAIAGTRIDASALSGDYFGLDYVSRNPATPFTVNLTPGQHFVYTYGSTVNWFTVAADGTVSYDAALEGVFTGRGSNSLQIHGATIPIDASALSGDYFGLDYVSRSPGSFSATLLPGQHFVYTYGSTVTWFNVAANGTISYDAALEGVLSGRGTHALRINGSQIQIDASALSGDYFGLDYASRSPATPFGATLLPGQHFVYTYGSTITWFTVEANGTISYDAALEGILSGRGTHALRVNGSQIQIDASALSVDYFGLDYASRSPATPFSATLLPGQHFVYSYGSTVTWFTIAADGTIGYDTALEGVFSGRGTHSLHVNGSQVQIDASALSGDYFGLDYVSRSPAAPFSATLLPGQHFVYTYGNTVTWFTVAADGTIGYDTALEGIFSGRGTSALHINGSQVQVDASALSTNYLVLDYVFHDPAESFSATLLPGQHFVYSYGGTATWFTIAADGTISYDAALEGVLSGRGTHSLSVNGVSLWIDPSTLGGTYLSFDYVMRTPGQPFAANLLPGQHVFQYDTKVAWFTLAPDGTITADPVLAGVVSLNTPIAQVYASIPNAAQFLGNPVGPELPTGVNGGRSRKYERGHIYWTPNSAFVLTGPIADKYEALGGPRSILGMPASNVLDGTSGMQYANFQNGVIYWTQRTGAHELHGAILQRYQELRLWWSATNTQWDPSGLGFVQGTDEFYLGYPKTDVKDVGNGHQVAEFEHGAIYANAFTTYELDGPIWDKYVVLRARWRFENISYDPSGIGIDIMPNDADFYLGQATGGIKDLGNGRQWVEFENGAIYWTASTGAYELHGPIWDKYVELRAQWRLDNMIWDFTNIGLGTMPNDADFYLGQPTRGIDDLGSGRQMVECERGAIYWSNYTHAHEMHGVIGNNYKIMNALGFLGLPMDDVLPFRGNGLYQRFEYGLMYWTPTLGCNEVHGKIGEKYALMHGPAGVLGLPNSNEREAPNGRVSYFEHGMIYYAWGEKEAFEVHGALYDAWVAYGAENGIYGWPTSSTIEFKGLSFSKFEGGYFGFATGFDPMNPHADVAKFSDVNQENSGTCVMDATFAALIIAHERPTINALGDNEYDVYLPGAAEWQRVYFNGIFIETDARPVRDGGVVHYWPLLVQRAVLQHFNVDWSNKDWESSPAGESSSWADPATVLHLLTGFQSYQSSGFGSPDELNGFLVNRDVLIAATRPSSAITGTVGKKLHAYAVEDVYQIGEDWYVELYNPWGVDAMDEERNVTSRPGDKNPNDGLVVLSWDDFVANFEGYARAARS